MDNFVLIASGVLFVSLILYLVCASYGLISDIKLRKLQLQLDRYNINLTSELGDKTLGILENLIEECFSEYILLNIEFKEILYIDSKLEIEITKGVAKKVVERISESFVTKLSLLYNTDNLPKLLSERVYLHTLDYTIKKNEVKE